MKFLGWMHRKFMQNSTEPVKNSTIGQTLFDEANYHAEPKNLSNSNIKCRKMSNRFEVNEVEALVQDVLFEPFDFLAIGTFGMELPNTDPPTPTLPLYFEKMTDQTEITENDLKLINYELEKFLEAEEREFANDISQRSSQASIITLSNKPIAGGADSEDHVYMVDCPLQKYLFATSIELAETDKEVKKENSSLEELFTRNNMVHDGPIREYERAEKPPRETKVTRFVKKVVKKFSSSSSSSMASSKNDAAVTISIKKKLSKVVKMFHRKVHPEEMTEKHFAKPQKGETKYISNENIYQIGDDEKKIVGLRASKKSEKITMETSSNGICNGASTIGGHWIKTDSDYLVLEL